MEKRTVRVPGFLALLVLIGVLAGFVWYAIGQDGQPGADGRIALFGTVAAIVFVLVVTGFVVVNPNESRVIQFFGRYIGSVKRAGFHWVTPLTGKRKVSLRVRNFETARLKVSDADGNPVEIAAVGGYQVTDSAKGPFAADDYVQDG